MISGIFDTHAHFDDEAFDDDRDILLASMPQNGVNKIISCGCDIASSEKALQISEKYPFVFFSAGIHPEEAADTDQNDLETIERLLCHPKCKAVGEIGLDYYRKDCCPKELQLQRFEEQIIMAKKHDMPVIVHDREAHRDVFDLLQKHRPPGVIHCYSGSAEMMKEYIKLGFYIGFNGVVTFKNAKKPLENAAAVPIDRLLLETDAPYLAPVPFRGKRCDSSMISETAAVIAHAKGIAVQKLVDKAHENACRLFNI